MFARCAEYKPRKSDVGEMKDSLSLYFSQAICCKAVKHCAYFVSLEKLPQHTGSMLAGDFLHAPCIHNPFQLFATNVVRNAGYGETE